MGIMLSRAVRYQGATVSSRERRCPCRNFAARTVRPRRKLHRNFRLETIWSMPREREDFRLPWNNGDDPSRANFLSHGLNQANELRPAQGYCGWEADILGTTAPPGLEGVICLDHLHGARSP
jgi:hypothetical protein